MPNGLSGWWRRFASRRAKIARPTARTLRIKKAHPAAFRAAYARQAAVRVRKGTSTVQNLVRRKRTLERGTQRFRRRR